MDLWARQQEAVLAFGRRSNAQPALPILMQDAGALVGEMLETDFSGVAMIEGGNRLVLSAARVTGASETPSPPMTSECSLDTATSLGAYALSTAAPVVSRNLAKEERFCDLFLRSLGVVSALCVPLYLAKRGLGALGVFSTSIRDFTGDDARFVETIAHLLASSVGRLQVEEELRQRNELASTVLETIDRLVLVLDPKGSVQDINQACERMTGRSCVETRGKPFWDVFTAPEEAESVRRLLQNASSSAKTCEFQSIVSAKSEQRRTIAWSLKTTRRASGRVSQLLLIGADRTDQPPWGREPRESKTVAPAPAEPSKKHLDPRALVQTASVAPTAAEIADTVGQVDGVAGEHPFAPLGGKVGREMRRSPRRNFQYLQWIAPMPADRLPTQDEFFQVRCNDISAGGISFTLDHAPDFQELVVALGRPSQRTYFVARVVRTQIRQDRSGPTYLVGCQFSGRVTL